MEVKSKNTMKKILFTTINGMLRPFKGRGLSNTKIGRFVYGKIFVPNKPNYVIVEGFKLYIHEGKDILSDSLLISKEYEPVETKVIKDIVKEEDVVVDAGANIGYYTILLSKIVGARGKVYAFEPEKSCFDLLKQNCRENKCYNVILINKALSNKEGEIKFYINEKDKGLSSIIKTLNTTKVIVKTTTLNKEISEPIDFMKIDIEGAELQALQGATTSLRSCNKMVIEIPEDREDFNDIKELLIKNKYKIERLDIGNILCEKKNIKEVK